MQTQTPHISPYLFDDLPDAVALIIQQAIDLYRLTYDRRHLEIAYAFSPVEPPPPVIEDWVQDHLDLGGL